MESYEKKLNILYQAQIQLSAHTINGWEGQYALMMRFYKRAINSNDKVDELDFWISFFQCCFHLKDWVLAIKKNTLKNLLQKLDQSANGLESNEHKKELRKIANELKSLDWNKRLNQFINENESMRICRDICNGTKHLVLSNASIDKHFAIFYVYNPWHKATNEKHSDWIIFVNGRKNKMSVLAQNCIQNWNDFIKSEGLITSANT